MTKSSNSLSLEEWLALTAMLAVMIVGFWQANVALGSASIKENSFTFSDFKEGRATASLGAQLDKNIPLRSELIAWANAGRYLIARGAGEQVRLGKDDWLFSVEELQYFPEASRNEATRVAVLSQAASMLEALGVDLVVAVVPDKSRMLQHMLSSGRHPDWNINRYKSIVDALRLKNVTVVDLQSELSSDSAESALYYRTDTHWNQAGAKRAALAVATQVKVLASDLPPTTFLTRATEASKERPGDLMRMMGLADMPNWTRPRPDMETPDSTQKVDSSQPSGLFDEVNVSVVLVGTSYSLRGNFHGYLQQSLGAEVLNVALDGGGFIQAVKAYLADESFQSAKPRVIIWEIPERAFSTPLTEQESKGLSF